MSQEVLAGLVGRTSDWLGKVENDRIDLDRLSVIKSLADALDVAVGDLIGEPSLMDWTDESGMRTVPAVRAALMDYRLITPFGRSPAGEPVPIGDLEQEVTQLWDAYQASRFGYVTGRLPTVLEHALAAAETYKGDDLASGRRLLGLTYQLAAVQLTKLGEAELAWIAADRGLATVRDLGDATVTGSLFRGVVHAMLAAGRFREAVALTEQAAAHLQPELRRPSPAFLSVYGTLFLAGAMAASRANDPATTAAFLAEADDAARKLGGDANHMWTAFGPTNVAIHRVATAAELGNIQVALDLGPRVDTTTMPMERRVRHALEVARAYSARNRTDEAVATLLDAERMAPEQVRHHFLSRQLVLTWIRQHRGRPASTLVDLAQRLKVLT
jgi:hypothetical protein